MKITESKHRNYMFVAGIFSVHNSAVLCMDDMPVPQALYNKYGRETDIS